RRQREEAHVSSGEDQCVRETLETPELRREEIESLGRALVERPLLAAVAGDDLPELEIIARQIVRALVELNLIAATHDPQARGLERRQAAECREELAAQLSGLVARRIGARASIRAAAELRLH